jgi:RHS repeat-associated protein
MIAKRTGKLEGITRSDYLPFGESANQLGGRAATQGYVNESVRQGFTGYEEDGETGLDYAQARYYANGQGRFTAADPLMASADPVNPQSFNRYSYALNNPTRFTDPTGLITESEYDGTEEKLIPLRKIEEKTKQQAAEEARRQAEMEAISQQFWQENGMEPLGAAFAEFANNRQDRRPKPAPAPTPPPPPKPEIELDYDVENATLTIFRILNNKAEQVGSLRATSGKGDCMNDVGCEDNANTGPIPRGNYTLKVSELSVVYGIAAVGRTVWRRGDWGTLDAPLRKTEDNKTLRDGFHLHGGAKEGSAGCIDVGGGVIKGNTSTYNLIRALRSDSDGVIKIVVR